MEPDHPVAYYTMIRIQNNLLELEDVMNPKTVYTTGPDPMLRGFMDFMYGNEFRKNYPPPPDPPIAGDPLWRELRGMHGKVWRKYRWDKTKRTFAYLSEWYRERVEYNGRIITRKALAEEQNGTPHWQAKVIQTSRETDKSEHRSCVEQLRLADSDPNFTVQSYG